MSQLMQIQEWLSQHGASLRKYFGKWVAISGSGVVASAESRSALVKKIPAEQRADLLLTRVPTPKESGALAV